VPRPSAIDPALARALRDLRAKKRLTQEDLAHRAGLTVAALARIERGQSNPTWASVRAIASGLEVGLAELARAVQRMENQ